MLVAAASLMDEDVADRVSKSVTKPLKRVWLTMAATICFAVGAGLFLACLFVLLLPHVGSAAALAVIGFIAVAAGGGFLLYLRRT